MLHEAQNKALRTGAPAFLDGTFEKQRPFKPPRVTLHIDYAVSSELILVEISKGFEITVFRTFLSDSCHGQADFCHRCQEVPIRSSQELCH